MGLATLRSTIRYYSRPLYYKKLVEHDFIGIPQVKKEVAHIKAKIKLRPKKNYVVASKTKANVSDVHRLYAKYMESFCLSMMLSQDEIENYFFNDNYVKTLLVKNDKDETVDFISYVVYDIHDNISNGDTGDIVSVTLNGVKGKIVSFNKDNIFIIAGRAKVSGRGEVAIESKSYGKITKYDGYTYNLRKTNEQREAPKRELLPFKRTVVYPFN